MPGERDAETRPFPVAITHFLPVLDDICLPSGGRPLQEICKVKAEGVKAVFSFQCSVFRKTCPEDGRPLEDDVPAEK